VKACCLGKGNNCGLAWFMAFAGSNEPE